MKKKEERRALSALMMRMAGFLIGAAGIVFHSISNQFFENGFMVRHNLAYFTLQTNIFSVLLFGYLAGKTLLRHGKTKKWEVVQANHSLHLACTVYITVTMLGFWLVLAPLTGINPHPALLADTMLLHTVTPLLAVADYLLFAEHGGLQKREIFKWMAYPVGYLLSVTVLSRLIRQPYYSFRLEGQLVELWYPYPFLDPQVMGGTGVALAVAGLAAVFVLLSLLFLKIDQKLGKRH